MKISNKTNEQIYMDDLGRAYVGERGLGRHEEGQYLDGALHTTGRILRPAHPAEMAQLRRYAQKYGYSSVAESLSR